MTSRDAVLRLLADHPVGLTDGDLAGMVRRRLTTIDRVCTELAADDLITRDDTAGLIINRLDGAEPPLPGGASSRLLPPTTLRAVQREAARHIGRIGGLVLTPVGNPITAATASGGMLRVAVTGRVVPERVRSRFADAVLTGLCLRAEHPDDEVALAFPVGGQYRALADDVAPALEPARVDLWFVHETAVTHHRDLDPVR